MNQPKVTPKDFFLWVAAMAALYVSTVSMIALWFEYIDRLAGTVYAYADPFSTGIRVAVASLVIIFPLYIFLTRILHQDIRAHGEKRELWIRRWLMVLTLFIAGATMVVDLIVLLNTFLGGEELTTAFLLKVITVLVVVGGVFLYYLHEAKGTWGQKEGASKLIGGVVSIIVLASVVAAFFIIGTPRELRLMRYDQQKVYDLQAAQSQVTTYWQQKEALPASLEDLKDPLSGFVVPEDPQAEEDAQYTYDYRVLGPQTFELCAFFNAESADKERGAVRPRGGYDGLESEYWSHGAGRVCFERTVDPEKYPPFESTLRAKPIPVNL